MFQKSKCILYLPKYICEGVNGEKPPPIIFVLQNRLEKIYHQVSSMKMYWQHK